ncbi:MAG: DUF6639 family protein [Roseovarius sp.]
MPKITVLFACYLMALGFFAPSIPAASIICEDDKFSVYGASPDQAEAVCSVLVSAKALLADCGIAQTFPLDIHIVRQLRGDSGIALLGTCLPEDGRIEILSRADFRERLVKDGPLASIPQKELYDSFIVHELTHALYFQTMSKRPQCRAANEYIASAMQIAYLTEESRDAFLSNFGPLPDGSLNRFNEFVLAVNPLAFSANAYLHFIRPENGCQFIRKVLAREVTFPDESSRRGQN